MFKFLFLFFFLIYVGKVYPSLTVGDSGELITASWVQGIPHPPGYPLYVIAGKVFSFFPFGNVAFRLNLMSAFFGALTVAMLFAITVSIIKSIARTASSRNRSCFSLPFSRQNIQTLNCLVVLASALTAFIIAFSHTFLRHSVTSEVYTLNTFLIVLFFGYCMNCKGKRLGVKHLSFLAFIAGLGLGNHHTFVLVFPSLLILIYPSFKLYGITGFAKKVIMSSFFFIMGVSTYLYLPVRSIQNPLLDWAHPRYLENFLYSFLRQGYASGYGGFLRTPETWMKQLGSIDLVTEFGMVSLIVGTFGLYNMMKEKRFFLLPLTALFLCFTVLIIMLAGDFDGELGNLVPFYLPAYLSFAVLVGIGFFRIMENIHYRWNGRVTPLFAMLVVVVAAVSGPIQKSFANKTKDDFLAVDYGLNKLNSIHEGALYFAKTDTDGFALWYLQKVERYRADVDVIPVYFLGEKWYVNEAMRYAGQAIYESRYAFDNQRLAMVGAITKNHQDNRYIYAGFSDNEFIPPEIKSVSHGIMFRLSTYDLDHDDSVWDYYRLRGIEPINEETAFLKKGVLEDYAASYYNLGLEWYSRGKIKKSLKAFEASHGIKRDDPDTLNNLALINAEEGTDLDVAERMAKKAISLYDVESEKANARDTLAWVYYRAGKFQAAFDELIDVEKYMKGDPSYHYHRGMVGMKRGDFTEAKNHLNIAVRGMKGDRRNEIERVLKSIGRSSGKTIGL